LVIGSSDANSVTENIVGEWYYSEGEGLLYLDDSDGIKLVLAGTTAVETNAIVNLIADYQSYAAGLSNKEALYYNNDFYGPVDLVVNRELPNFMEIGEESTVTLTIDIYDAPRSFTLEEYYPDTWQFVSSDTQTASIDAGTGIITWDFNVNTGDPAVENRVVSYTVIPAETGEAFFAGDWFTLVPGILESTAGDVITTVCTDSDNDGYKVEGGACGEIDCNDFNASIHPGAVETCNNADDNCNGVVDDDIDGTDICDGDKDGSPVSCFGIESPECKEDCNDNNPAVNPDAEEICNGINDDCDSTIDKDASTGLDLTQACYTGAEGTENVGICHAGTETCSDAAWGACIGEQVPETELCDIELLDEDCDGQPNLGCGCTVNDILTCGIGACAGTKTCDINGQWNDCDYSAEPIDEICFNSIDDDCDGTADEECHSLKDVIVEVRGKTKSEKNFRIVIGEQADLSDNIGAIEIAGITGISSTVMESEVIPGEPLIIVGGPCANSIAAEFTGNTYQAYPECAEGFEPGAGGKIVYNPATNRIMVAGYSAMETRIAARAIAKYSSIGAIEDNLITNEVTVMGTLSNPLATAVWR